MACYALKKDNSPIRGATKAYRESQTRIYKIEAPMYVGVGEGIDSLDFHADLSALKVILPDETHERPLSSQPVPRSDSPLLQQLKTRGDYICTLCMVRNSTADKIQVGRALLPCTLRSPPAFMLCSAISVSDNYGEGATAETEEFCIFWDHQVAA